MSYRTASGAEPVARGSGRPTARQWAVIAVMITAALMDMPDVTVVNVALPTIRHRLHAGPAELEWVVAGYALALGATLIFWDRAGDLFGRRRVFLAGVAVFGAASLAAGLSRSPAQLIAARLAAGGAAGALVPQVLATFRAGLAEKARLTAFGIYGAVAGLAAAIGVIPGGVLTHYSVPGLGWRAVFLVNVPVCAAVLAFAVPVVPESQSPPAGSLDVPGWVFAVLPAGAAGLAVLVVLERHRERRGAAALLQGRPVPFPRLQRRGGHPGPVRPRVAGLLVHLHLVGATQAWLLTAACRAHPHRLQRWRHPHRSPRRPARRTPRQQGADLRGRAARGRDADCRRPGLDRRRAAKPVAAARGLGIAGAGLGLLVVPLVNVVLAVPASSAGGASGIFSTAQQLGGALGIAAIGTLFFAPAPDSHLNGAFGAAAPAAAAAYGLAALLCILRPARAVSDAQVIAAG